MEAIQVTLPRLLVDAAPRTVGGRAHTSPSIMAAPEPVTASSSLAVTSFAASNAGQMTDVLFALNADTPAGRRNSHQHQQQQHHASISSQENLLATPTTHNHHYKDASSLAVTSFAAGNPGQMVDVLFQLNADKLAAPHRSRHQQKQKKERHSGSRSGYSTRHPSDTSCLATTTFPASNASHVADVLFSMNTRA